MAIARAAALAGFYDALDALASGEATDHLRIAVFGDSNLTLDLPTGRLRRRLQRWLGDGGHGFVALGRPWAHYKHMDVVHDVSGWTSYAITTKPTGDGMYGLSGIAAENQWQGAVTWVETAREGSPVGTKASRFDVFFAARPGGGAVRLLIDREGVGEVDTRASGRELGMRRLVVPDAAHRLEVVSASAQTARMLGVALERDAPGVVVDSFGVGSLNTKSLGRHDPEFFRSMLERRRYDLIVFMTGANDLFTMDAVPGTMKKVLSLCRAALPRASLLMLTPPDRGLIKPMRETQLVVAQRRVVAEEEGCALWDQFEAMGGAGSMARFVKAELAMKDAVHLNDKGAAFIADRLLDALLEGHAGRAQAPRPCKRAGQA